MARLDGRTEQILALRREGWTHARIAGRFNIHRSRVGQILKRAANGQPSFAVNTVGEAERAAMVKLYVECGMFPAEIGRWVGRPESTVGGVVRLWRAERQAYRAEKARAALAEMRAR